MWTKAKALKDTETAFKKALYNMYFQNMVHIQ